MGSEPLRVRCQGPVEKRAGATNHAGAQAGLCTTISGCACGRVYWAATENLWLLAFVAS